MYLNGIKQTSCVKCRKEHGTWNSSASLFMLLEHNTKDLVYVIAESVNGGWDINSQLENV